MSFELGIAKQIAIDAGWRCEQSGKCFYPDGTYMRVADFIVPEGMGNWNGQASHKEKRDYRGRDRNRYNPDGSPRGEYLATLEHAFYEVQHIGSLRNALTLLTTQTIRTFDFIRANGNEDYDLSLKDGQELGLARLETIELNNQRRDALTKVLIKRGAMALNKPTDGRKTILSPSPRRRI